MKRFQLDMYRERIIYLYLEQRLSCKAISEEIGCSLSGIYDALKRWNVPTRSLSESHRIKKYNENYFEVIDNEDKAYWLGFIYADGYITSGNNLGISLSNNDIGHLNKFINSLNGNFKPSTYRATGYSTNLYSRVLLKSEKIIADIKNKGVKYRKSLILEFPTENQVPRRLIRHFIRGYFDGDGSIILSKNSINFKVCGTKEFLYGVIDTLNYYGSYEYKHKLYKRTNDAKNSYYISFGGRLKVLDTLDFLYKDSNIYLDRKYEKYKKLIY